ADVASDRDMQFVNFLQTVGLLHLPHPLFADEVNVESVRRVVAIVDVNHGAPAEHTERKDQRNDDPRILEAHITVDGNTDCIGLLAMEFEKEIDDGDGNSGGKEE